MKIIFVGGTGRCGKSVVAECLARHPDAIKLPFELRFLTDPDGIVDFYASSLASWSPYLADKRIKRLGMLLTTLAMSPRTSDLYAGWQLGKHLPTWKEHVGSLMQSLYDFAYDCKWVGMSYKSTFYHAGPPDREDLACILGTFVQAVIRDFLNKHGKSIFISDDTWSVLFARELSELLPEAKFIHVRRDLRDVISSMSKQAWCPSELRQATRYCCDLAQRIWSVQGDVPFGSYRSVDFEHIIRWPAASLSALCKFFFLEFNDAMLEPLNEEKANIGRWKDEADQEAFEVVMPLVKELGYE